ncbi:MAG: hypothetical protein HKN99_09300 [Winogradskyella sp.]|nr:hypothetical protein [Winogradskyella sp.]NNC46064.1 hypothetical protein [Winogradskyella sp.]
MKLFNDYRIVILLCLTLGLAPFHPEPHLIGKLRWLMGGGNGMKFMDYFDLVLHGMPFLLLLRLIFKKKNSK